MVKSRFYCFYHKDMDGWLSGAIVKYFYPKINMIPIDYGDRFPLEEIQEDDVVFMLDFFPSDFSVMEQIADLAFSLIWVDHHVSSIQEAKERKLQERLTEDSVMYLDEGHSNFAACELTYKYFFNVDYEQIPYYVKLIGRYDVGDFSDKNTILFNFGLSSWITDPKDGIQPWKKIIENSARFKDIFDNLVQRGQYIYEYQKRRDNELADKFSFELDFDGYNAIAANTEFVTPNFFQNKFSSYDMLITFVRLNNSWKLGFYSNKIDVAEIAKECGGGGGNSNSAGAIVNNLPKEIKEAINV